MLWSKKSWNSRLSSYCRNTVYFLNLHTAVTWFGCFLILRYFRCKRSASRKWVIREWVLKRVAIVLLGVAKQTKGERHEFTDFQHCCHWVEPFVSSYPLPCNLPRHRLELSPGSAPRQVHSILRNLAYDLNYKKPHPVRAGTVWVLVLWGNRIMF